MKKLDVNLLEQKIGKRAESDIKKGIILGANVAVVQKGKTVLCKSYGYKNVEKTEKLDSNCTFRIASMTKPITAVSVLREIEKGRIDLFDTVEKFIPEFSNLKIGEVKDGKINIVSKAVTKPRIIHLLTHTSGIGSLSLGDFEANKMPKKYNVDLKSTVSYYARQPIAFEPYTKVCYSPTVAFDVLARIVEIVSGKSFDKYLKEEIFKPLEMKDTTFCPNHSQWNRLVDMQDLKDGKVLKYEMPKDCVFFNIPTTHFCGGAGLVSTINDYINFAKMLLNKGEFNGKRILSEYLVNSMAIPHVPENICDGYFWGLGVRVVTKKEYKILPVGSFGWSGAFGTHFWIDPENEVSGIYMRNSVFAGGSEAITARNFEQDLFDSFNK